MSTKTRYDLFGNPLYVEADAGKKGEKRLRANFSLKKFGSLEEAQREAENWEQRMHSMKRMDTSDLFLKSRRDQEKCLEALELLEPYSDQIDVAGAAKFWLMARQKEALQTPWTYREASEHWLEDKRDAKQSEKYTGEMENFFTTTSRYFGKRLLDSITVEDLKALIKDRDKLMIERQKKRGIAPVGLAASSRNNFKKLFSILFNYAIEQRHASHNPAAALLTTKIVRKPAELLTPDQARDYLSACEIHFLPYAVAGFFAGIRPEGEMQRMKTSDFKFDQMYIDVRAAASKTNQRRPIEMMPNLYVWLKPIAHLFDKPLTSSEVRGARDRAAAASSVDLPRDPFRKCFASYHYARFQDLKKSMYMVGHTNAKTFFDHYFDSADQTDAIAYFGLLPSSCKFLHEDVRKLYESSTVKMPEPKVLSMESVG
jgi:integrase